MRSTYGKPLKVVRFLKGRFKLHIYAGVGDHSDLALLAPAEVVAANRVYARIQLDTVWCEQCKGFHMTGVGGQMASAESVDSKERGSVRKGATQFIDRANRLT